MSLSRAQALAAIDLSQPKEPNRSNGVNRFGTPYPFNGEFFTDWEVTGAPFSEFEKGQWRKFDTPLKLKPEIDLSKLEPNEYGMKLVQVADEIKSDRIKKLVNDYEKKSGS